MAKRSATKQKGRGRHPTVRAEKFVGVRLPENLLKEIDRWAAARMATRSEAIRRLTEFGLSLAPASPSRDPDAASKASKLAATQVRALIDPLLPEQEKRTRGRILIRGPKEFRGARVDQPKKSEPR
jgi:hypothetical protein